MSAIDVSEDAARIAASLVNAESAAIVLEQSANDWEIAQIQKLLLKLPQEKLKMWRQMLEIYIAAETKRD